MCKSDGGGSGGGGGGGGVTLPFRDPEPTECFVYPKCMNYKWVKRQKTRMLGEPVGEGGGAETKGVHKEQRKQPSSIYCHAARLAT